MFSIGLTGGFGTGKTTVLKMFARLGARVIDSDAVVHRLLKNDGRLKARMKKHFGPGVFRRAALTGRRSRPGRFQARRPCGG